MTSIHLLPLHEADRELADALVPALSRSLRIPIVIKNTTLDVEPYWDIARGQYNSTRILCSLKKKRQHAADDSEAKVLAITGNDLFIPILTFVFGEAELFGTHAIASYHRLHNELYGLPEDRTLLLLRFCKECLHELGHTFGLVHCHEQECVMRSSTNVEEIDLKGPGFCAKCSNLLPNNNGRKPH